MGPTREEVVSNLSNFKEICTMIGIHLSAEKIFEPARVMDFIEKTLDAERMEARLPDDKIFRMQPLSQTGSTLACTNLSPLAQCTQGLNRHSPAIFY